MSSSSIIMHIFPNIKKLQPNASTHFNQMYKCSASLSKVMDTDLLQHHTEFRYTLRDILWLQVVTKSIREIMIRWSSLVWLLYYRAPRFPYYTWFRFSFNSTLLRIESLYNDYYWTVVSHSSMYSFLIILTWGFIHTSTIRSPFIEKWLTHF